MDTRTATLLSSAHYADSRQLLRHLLGKSVSRLWILQSAVNGSTAVDGRPALELTEPTVTIEFEFQKHCTVGFLPDNSVVASSERIDAEDDSEFRGQDISNWPCCSPFITESLMGVGALVDRDDNTEGIIGGLRFVFSSDQTLVVDYRRFRGFNKSHLTHRVRFANDASLARWWCDAPWLEIPDTLGFDSNSGKAR